MDDFDFILFELCAGDLSKKHIIEEVDHVTCIEWYYQKRVNELNKLKSQLESLKKMKKK